MTLLRVMRLALLVLIAVVLQTTVFSELRLWGGGILLGLLLTIAVAFICGSNTGAIFGFICGVVFDLFLTNTPVGLSALSYSLTGYVMGYFEGSMLRSSLLVTPIFAAGGSAFGMLVFVTGGAILGVDAVVDIRTLGVVFVTATVNSLAAPLVFAAVGWAAREPEDRVRVGWKA
jgi:rod shape-determining protein MreD